MALVWVEQMVVVVSVLSSGVEVGWCRVGGDGQGN